MNTDLYSAYKPMRNFMREFDPIGALEDVWRLSLHVMEGQALPIGYPTGMAATSHKPLRKILHPWQLNTLARELVLNARSGGKRSLAVWHHLARAINHILDLEGEAYSFQHTGPQDALQELHRNAQQQFPWHPSNQGVNPMTRYLKVFGESEVNNLVVDQMKMTMDQFVTLGLAVSGHFFRQPGMSTDQYYGVLGISREASEAFFSRITLTMAELRAETAKKQCYDRDWSYTFNPLEFKPLIAFDAAHPDRVICPIPRFLVRRTQGGIFFDLVKMSGFDNPFGNSFQAYLGEVMKIVCPASNFRITPEEPFYVGKDLMHGVDWILSDQSGHLFLESKTKRLTLDAKIRSDTTALEKDLAILAEAITQNYQNLQWALDGKTKWKPDGLPIYPVILTLEDWFVFSPSVQEILKRCLEDLFMERNMPLELLKKMPYVIMSAADFEIVAQIIAQTNIATVMAWKTDPEHCDWSWLPFLFFAFKKEFGFVNLRLFPDVVNRLTPKLPD